MPVNQGTDFENLANTRNLKGANIVNELGKECGPNNAGLGNPNQAPSSAIDANLNTSDLAAQSKLLDEEEADDEVIVETNISKLLSERTTKVVIIIVLIMLFFQPVFQSDTYLDDPGESDQALAFLSDLYDKNQSWSLYQGAAAKLQLQMQNSDLYPLVYM
jgi:hypothetical protein